MLTITDLSLGYGDEPVLYGLDLSVVRGEFASIVGPSGCGKSSLLRAVVGLHRPDVGRIQVEVERTSVGFLFQDDALLPWRTARQNVALPLTIRGVRDREADARADEWLARMGLAGMGDRYPHELSGGQRKRVSLAQVLGTQPDLLLMDEPFASLDAIVRRRVTEDLISWVERNDTTVVLVTHDLEEAITLSDRVHLMDGGPYATILDSYDVPIARPRDLVAVRTDPAFGALLQQVWEGLARALGEEEPVTVGAGR